MLDNSFRKEVFPNRQFKLPLTEPEIISLCPIQQDEPSWLALQKFYSLEEADLHLTITSLQAIVESNKVSPEPSFLQTKPLQLPQLLLLMLVLQTFHQLCCSSLDMLQHLHILLVLKGPGLCQVQRENPFPSSSGHTTSDTSQNAISTLLVLTNTPSSFPVSGKSFLGSFPDTVLQECSAPWAPKSRTWH